MAPRRILTGITPSGIPHLGNYVGAIRPAIAASRREDAESFYFLADLHALVKTPSADRVRESTLAIAATWLACGLDPERVCFYRQSDIVEIPELSWMLTCVTAKGLLNRAHAYKAAVDANLEAGEDADAAVTAGLYMYPVLMAADILAFGAHEVPVGRDQVQHIEMARDIGQRFNHRYGEDFLVLPEARIEEHVATLPGTDGRKMSKSYDNTIPLWLPEGELRKAVFAVVTDSREPGEPKDADSSHLFALYQAFASANEAAAMREAFAKGIAWGEAKQQVFERINAELAPMRERYEALVADPAAIERLLAEGAARARAITRPLLERLRVAVGLGGLAGLAPRPDVKASPAAARPPVLKSYREDGAFLFKLEDGDGALLLQSRAFASPREAGQLAAALVEQADSADALAPLLRQAAGADASLDTAAITAALQALRADREAKAAARKG